MSANRRQGPEIAVVIPSRDRWPMLRTALASALAQRDVDVQVVVVNDGSTDATTFELEGLSDPRVSVLRNHCSEGVSAARNRGLREVTAPWVGFLDDDDVWAPDHLATMLGAASRSGLDPERVGIVFSGHLVVDRQRHVIGVEPMKNVDGIRERMKLINPLGGPSMVLLRTHVVRSVGGFDERLSIVADWDLWVRVLAEHEAVHSPELSVAYMRHPGNMQRDTKGLLNEFAALRQKHHWESGGLSDSLSDGGLPLAIAATYRAGGQRFRAAGWYLRSFLARRVRRDLVRAGAVIVGERVIALSRLRAPNTFDQSVGAWLGEIRAAETAATSGLPPLWSVSRSNAALPQ